MQFAVDFHEHIIQMPLSMDPCPHGINPPPPGFSGEHQPKAVILQHF
jgi:hypothetical protein